jgi:PhoPQ-activated pathogenicity-related protein
MLRHLLILLFFASRIAAETPVPSELGTYVNRPEPKSSWEIVSQTNLGLSDLWHLKLTSQVWQDIPWEHDLLIFRPKDCPPGSQMLLINNGGVFNPVKTNQTMLGAMLAQRVNAPVAVLLGVPNQPLFNHLREDHLIAETFVRYLDTGDASWPLLFPMVKSVVKSMDILQQFSREQWQQPLEKFVLTGASKRGWTTWLSAAIDPRITAIAPMVIDVVNIPEQLPHQIATFGKPSDQIHPYTERGLVPLPDTPAAKKLWTMVDPWSYRSKFTMPKLIVLGNNDPYWTTDALNLYWEGLPGEKYISYTPNAGHNHTEMDPSVDNIAAFVRLHFKQQALPKITWVHDDTSDNQLQLTVTTETTPQRANLWFATSPTKDFRTARWQSRPVDIKPDGRIHLTHPKPTSGHYAYSVDLAYPVDDLTLWLCTQLRIASPAE